MVLAAEGRRIGGTMLLLWRLPLRRRTVLLLKIRLLLDPMTITHRILIYELTLVATSLLLLATAADLCRLIIVNITWTLILARILVLLVAMSFPTPPRELAQNREHSESFGMEHVGTSPEEMASKGRSIISLIPLSLWIPPSVVTSIPQSFITPIPPRRSSRHSSVAHHVDLFAVGQFSSVGGAVANFATHQTFVAFLQFSFHIASSDLYTS